MGEMKEKMRHEVNGGSEVKGKVEERSFYGDEDDVLCKCRPEVRCPPLDNINSKDEIGIVD